MVKVEVYTQAWCPYCMRALQLLRSKNVEVSEIKAGHGTAERAEATRRSGGHTTMPQIFIDGRPIGGCDELVALDRAGGLDPLLQPA
jgi:glutaredoxin 3